MTRAPTLRAAKIIACLLNNLKWLMILTTTHHLASMTKASGALWLRAACPCAARCEVSNSSPVPRGMDRISLFLNKSSTTADTRLLADHGQHEIEMACHR